MVTVTCVISDGIEGGERAACRPIEEEGKLKA